jgi:hypothetical protein
MVKYLVTKQEARVFLIYYGFLLLLLPLVIPLSSSSLTLSTAPEFLGFENDFSDVGKVTGSPEIVDFPISSGKKSIECKNGDFVRWDLTTPARTLDLRFNVYWKELPIAANESLTFAGIYGVDYSGWQDISVTDLYCDQNKHRGWILWSGVPSSRGGFVSSDVVYNLQTDRWYNIRIRVDMDKGTYKLFMNEAEIASITNVVIPQDVHIDFFRLGFYTQSDRAFVIYYDDVAVSLLRANESSELSSSYKWFPVHAIGIGLIGVGGYLWWSQKKEKQRK